MTCKGYFVPTVLYDIKEDAFIFLAEKDFAVTQSHLYQGRMSGGALFLLACIHPVMSCRAGWSYVIHGRLEFHPSMS